MNMIELIAQAATVARRSKAGESYTRRHDIRAQTTLTVTDETVAAAITHHLEPRIRDKIVVDLGGAFGLLGFHLAEVAARVFVIEANPVYCAAYTELVHNIKPRNLSFLFGDAREFVGHLNADVAVVATHSDVSGMMDVAKRLAAQAIDVYGELIAANPEGFDEWARNARMTS